MAGPLQGSDTAPHDKGSYPLLTEATSNRTALGHETELCQHLDNCEHQSPAVQRSNTAPASCEHFCPIKTAPKIVQSASRDSEPWVRTIHIHLDRLGPKATRICRCLLDTGSDLNLISQRILASLGLAFNPCRGPPVTGIGGIEVAPIGSVVLTWHMDGRQNTKYSEQFWVISNNPPARFDVLLGSDWIMETGALLRNREIMLARCFGLHFGLLQRTAAP